MSEMEAGIAMVTETWLRDGQDLENLKENFMEGEDIGTIAENILRLKVSDTGTK